MAKLIGGSNIIFSLIVVASCSHNQPAVVTSAVVVETPSLNIAIPEQAKQLESSVNLPSIEDIFLLELDQQERFYAFMNSKDKNRDLHRSVALFLEDISGEFSYHEKTSFASQALREQKGNCLSLAILTTSLARLADVKIQYQKVFSEPVYQKVDNIVVRGDHVRSKLIDPSFKFEPGILTLFPPMVTIDYFPSFGRHIGGPITQEEFYSMIYSNLAAEAYIEKDYVKAFFAAKKSIGFNAQFGPALNTLALSLRQLGDDNQSEKVYRWTIQYADNIVEPLSNYIDWLYQNNRQPEALPLEKKLLELNQPNPFDFIERGYRLFDQRQFGLAEQMFLKAQDIAPYLHHAYTGMALIRVEQGRLKQAQTLLKKALDQSYSSESRLSIKGKLKALSIQ